MSAGEPAATGPASSDPARLQRAAKIIWIATKLETAGWVGTLGRKTFVNCDPLDISREWKCEERLRNV